MNSSADVLIVGGGIMGSATAYNLLTYAPELKVTVLEKDSSYEFASTGRSAANLRVQFNVKENIQMSQYGLEVLENFSERMRVDDSKPDTGFKQQGNLFIVTEEDKKAALEGVATQQALGAKVSWLEPEDVKETYPLYNLKDCAGGTFCPTDGSMSAQDILNAYRKKARSMGASYVEGSVIELVKANKRVTGAKLASGETYSAKSVLLATGAWINQLTRPIGIDLPIRPTKRQMQIVNTYLELEGTLPVIFFPSGSYLFHEAQGAFACGWSLPSDIETYDDFRPSRKTFEDIVWPDLASYVPALEQLKPSSLWTGLYAVNTFDGNGIFGLWPELENLYICTGFSGHGFQQSHAVGRYLAEEMLELPPSLDLGIFSPQRLFDNAPVFENKRKII